MIVIGVDAHKRSHTFVAVDAVGRKLGEKRCDATTDGHLEALRWAHTHGSDADLVWGIEDCLQVAGRLQRDLRQAGQKVVRVPTRLTARVRASARTRGKSDPIDALAVARAVLREPDLPVEDPDPASRELKLLVDRRNTLIEQRSAAICRLLWRIHELDPTHITTRPALDTKKRRNELTEWLAGQPGIVAELARDELDDITRASDTVALLTRRIGSRVRELAPGLLTLQGCGELSAASIIAETAGVRRFTSEAAFARHAGVAPIPHWSGDSVFVHRARTGNRQLNKALHRIAITQIRRGGPGRDYFEKRVASGDSPAKARRCLKRRLARVVFTRLTHEASTSCVDAGAARASVVVNEPLSPRRSTPPAAPEPELQETYVSAFERLRQGVDAWEAALGVGINAAQTQPSPRTRVPVQRTQQKVTDRRPASGATTKSGALR